MSAVLNWPFANQCTELVSNFCFLKFAPDLISDGSDSMCIRKLLTVLNKVHINDKKIEVKYECVGKVWVVALNWCWSCVGSRSGRGDI